MERSYFRLLAALVPFFCAGSFWIRYDFVAGGWEQRGLWPHGVVMMGLGSLVGGLLQERFRPDRIAYAGALLLGLGFVGAVFTTTPLAQYWTIEGLIGFGSGVAYAAAIPLVARQVPGQVGLALGIAVAGYVPAGVVGSRVAAAIIEAVGRQSAAVIIGLALFVFTAVAIAILRATPEVSEASARRAQAGPAAMLLDPSFPSFWLSYALASMAAVIVYTLFPAHLSELVAASDGATPAVLGLVGPIGSLANLGARPIVGWLTDRGGGFTVLRWAIGLILVGTGLALIPLPSSALLAVPLTVMGGYGALLAIYPSLTASMFGLRHIGANYGIVLTAWAAGYVAAAWLAPRLARSFDSSAAGYVGAVLICLVAFFLAGRSARLRPVLTPRAESRFSSDACLTSTRAL
jgi:OFA family oxalate/formate antiporter-like MFS transporter